MATSGTWAIIRAMRLQLLSDLHLETESYDPEPALGAEALILAGDIDTRWDALALFKDWPVPVLMVAGNHEFDGRAVEEAWPALQARCEALGIQLLEQASTVLTGDDGRRIRFCGTVRWSDFDLFGASQRERAMRAAGYFQRVMNSRWRGAPLTQRRFGKPACNAAPGWSKCSANRPKGAGMPPASSPTLHPACAAPTHALASSPARPAFAAPTMT
ncbi:metallophosphoesterase family protein [Ideonella paludis]|uniref:phosphoesterase n=1 Tax=Ideonella paludis TaxID=1233411 RepID=UPI00363C6AC4